MKSLGQMVGAVRLQYVMNGPLVLDPLRFAPSGLLGVGDVGDADGDRSCVVYAMWSCCKRGSREGTGQGVCMEMSRE